MAIHGYPSIRHNEIRDFTAHLLSEVCHNVAIEPHLQPLQGEALHNQSSNRQSGAHLDIAADGFWGSRHERAFFDVRVFNPYAPSNRNSQLTTCYRSHENAKKRSYDQRIREVEHGSFTPLVLSCTGGMGRAAINTYKRLATLISTKRDDIYSSLVPRLSVKREMWGRKGEPGFYCRPDPSHSGGFGFPPYFPVFDFIIIIIFV